MKRKEKVRPPQTFRVTMAVAIDLARHPHDVFGGLARLNLDQGWLHDHRVAYRLLVLPFRLADPFLPRHWLASISHAVPTAYHIELCATNESILANYQHALAGAEHGRDDALVLPYDACGSPEAIVESLQKGQDFVLDQGHLGFRLKPPSVHLAALQSEEAFRQLLSHPPAESVIHA